MGKDTDATTATRGKRAADSSEAESEPSVDIAVRTCDCDGICVAASLCGTEIFAESVSTDDGIALWKER